MILNAYFRYYKKGYLFTNYFKSKYQNYSSETLSINFETGDLILNSGNLAKLADSSATGNINETHVLTTVVNKKLTEPKDFLPLTVEYLSKRSAYGRIPTTFTRRDQGASNNEILVSRVIDRSIRPLINKNIDSEIQIICNLLSFDGEQNPDVVCVNTVSYALQRTNLQWSGPVGCVRIGMVDSNFVVNPKLQQLELSPLNLLVTVNKKSEIVMLEGWADNLDQTKFIDALEFGVNEAHKVVKVIEDNTKKIENKKEEIEKKPNVNNYKQELYESVDKFATDKLIAIYKNFKEHDKKSRDDAVSALRTQTSNYLSTIKLDESTSIRSYDTKELFQTCFNNVFRNLLLNEELRCDGRRVDEVRPISSRVHLFKKLHGSSLFQRGQTQVLCTLTFDSPDTMYKAERIVDMVSPSIAKFDKNFMLHYEFPPYATNEIGRVKGPTNRRAIGHGALAEKSIYPVVPSNLPFTIRLLCETLESNGSSSMASVCAGSLALMDAGIDISEPVCGVAMGLITKIDDNEKIVDYKILTDLMGLEDYIGDMDFKIAGTRKGITAVQADIKIKGLPFNIAREALEKSLIARSHILDKMNEVISEKRTVDVRLPLVKDMLIPIHKRAKFIGVGGANIQRIEAATGVRINSINEDTFSIFAPTPESFEAAEKMINKILEEEKEPELEFGGVYTAKIVEIVRAGVMITLYPKMKPVLLHNNQLDSRKLEHGENSGLKVGQEIQVKYFGRDPANGAMRLSRKVLYMSTLKSKSFFDKEKDKETAKS